MKQTWRVEFDERARRELRKLDVTIQRVILKYLRERIATAQDPRRFGKALGGDRIGLWRYRVDAYRVLCRIEDETITVLVLRLAHRKEVYE